MKLSIQRDRKINKIIPLLLKENIDYSKEMKTKITLNYIFNEFENKAQNDFNYFIKDSNKRYSNIKSGQDINHYIEDFQYKYEDRLSKIMNDKFYTELNLQPEKEIIKYKSMKKSDTNIKSLLTNIRTNIISNKSNKNIFNYNSLNNQNRENRINKLNKYNKCYTENELTLNTKIIYDKEFFDKKNKNDIKSVFNLDNIKINNSIEKYKLNLLKIKTPYIKGGNAHKEENKKINFNLPFIDMLYYHKSKPNIKLKYNDMDKLDIKILLPFSKLGKYLPKPKSENKIIKSQDIPSFITEIKNKKWNYDNTTDIVMNSAKNNINLKNNYSFKRNKIKELLKYDIPTLDEYENIIRHKVQIIKNKRNNKNRIINKKQRLNFLSRKQLINLEIDKKIEFLKKKEKDLLK